MLDAYLALMLAYGVGNLVNDDWLEQVVKRGWTNHEVPSILTPAANWGWAAVLVGRVRRLAALVPSAEPDDARRGEPRDLVLRVAELAEDLPGVRAETPAAAPWWRTRSPSAESGAATVTKSPSDCRIPSASVWGCRAASPTSCTGDAGTPAATSASSSSADSRLSRPLLEQREQLRPVRDAVGVREEASVRASAPARRGPRRARRRACRCRRRSSALRRGWGTPGTARSARTRFPRDRVRRPAPR